MGEREYIAHFHVLAVPKNYRRQTMQILLYKALLSVRRTKGEKMTSTERREVRYQRRKAKREEKRRALNAKYDNYDNLISCNSLYHAALMSRRTIRWKASVQRYFVSLLRNILDTRKKLINGEDVTMGFIEFDIHERGKHRHIKSVHFKERVIQRTLCDNALIPILKRTLIYDNGASLKDRGISFTIGRLKTHMRRYYRTHRSNKGYILLIDFKKYFDNIQHDRLYAILERNIQDKRIVDLTKQFIEAFGDESVGIGSQVSQILAITYRNALDHYIKQELGIELYGCYMDDSYVIADSKEELHKYLKKIIKKCAEDGIIINEKKTQIRRIDKGFTFMKGKYFLTETGKVISKPCKENTTRERRKLKKFHKLVQTGEMQLKDVQCSYNSYRGYISKEYNAHRTIRNMDILFHNLFGWDVPINKKEK